ncbi:hypothetical protein V6N13_009434 [Hibiscus sabdariffa]
MAWITKQSAHRASIKKRMLGMLKKVVDLITLCGIEICLVIYTLSSSVAIVEPSLGDNSGVIAVYLGLSGPLIGGWLSVVAEHG